MVGVLAFGASALAGDWVPIDGEVLAFEQGYIVGGELGVEIEILRARMEEQGLLAPKAQTSIEEMIRVLAVAGWLQLEKEIGVQSAPGGLVVKLISASGGISVGESQQWISDGNDDLAQCWSQPLDGPVNLSVVVSKRGTIELVEYEVLMHNSQTLAFARCVEAQMRRWPPFSARPATAFIVLEVEEAKHRDEKVRREQLARLWSTNYVEAQAPVAPVTTRRSSGAPSVEALAPLDPGVREHDDYHLYALIGTAGARIGSGRSSATNESFEGDFVGRNSFLFFEADMRLNESFLVGAYFQYQFTLLHDFEARDEAFGGTCLGGDCLLGLRARYAWQEWLSSFGSLGLGRVRYAVPVYYYREDVISCADLDTVEIGGKSFCQGTDTTRPGWAHIGAGLTGTWRLNPQVSLAAEAQLLLTFPTSSLNLMMSVGPRIQF